MRKCTVIPCGTGRCRLHQQPGEQTSLQTPATRWAILLGRNLLVVGFSPIRDLTDSHARFRIFVRHHNVKYFVALGFAPHVEFEPELQGLDAGPLRSFAQSINVSKPYQRQSLQQTSPRIASARLIAVMAGMENTSITVAAIMVNVRP